jgi:hypothetical protein
MFFQREAPYSEPASQEKGKKVEKEREKRNGE